jgi:hypothetical protein
MEEQKMTATAVTVEATLEPDGVTLHLEQKLALPPGRVTLTVQPLVARSGPTMLEALDRVHRDQRLRGRAPMTEQEMAAEIAELRAEDLDYEARWREIWSQTSANLHGTDKP